MLENLAYPFVKPNILDIKLGTVLYDESATPEKRNRMENTARLTTSLETGVRLTGFQVSPSFAYASKEFITFLAKVHDNNTSQPVLTPKVYGKSIKASDLPDGIARFFPIASTPSTEPEERVTPSLGLPKSILLPILESLREDVAEILEAFHEVHLRMVGGSLLIVYEGDWERAAEGVKLFGLDESSGIEERENNDEDEWGDEEDEDDDDDDDEEEEEEENEDDDEDSGGGGGFGVDDDIDFNYEL